jgi:hypothetical protein
LEIVSIDAGRQIDRSDEHHSNADSPSLTIAEPASNAKCEMLLQDRKHELEIVSIDEGMQIYRRENACGEKEGVWLRTEHRTRDPFKQTELLGYSCTSEGK